MRLSNMMFRTTREVPTDAQMASHQLFLKAGLIRRISAGIYSLTPMATRALQNIGQLVREEMDDIGGQEVLLPIIQPASLWQDSGRYAEVDDTLVRFQDRSGQAMVLAMTHEEAVTDLFRAMVQSYRQLPMMVYQVQTKFRDEARPRAGLVRLREFMMKDAYSFHLTDADLDVTYQRVFAAYLRFFERCGLDVIAVQSDTGMMGGGVAHEFMFLSDAGEDTLLLCPHCHYAANREVAVAQRPATTSLDIAAKTQYRCEWFGYGDLIAMVICDAASDVNEVKVQRLLGWPLIDHLSEARIAGWASNGKTTAMIGVADTAVGAAQRQNAAGVAQALGLRAGNWLMGDVIGIVSGMPCAECGTPLVEQRGIEVGNIFKLGTKYSQPMNATVADERGELQPVIMGCYGIGLTRVLACIVEQHRDDEGIVWPTQVAPFPIHLIQLGDEVEVREAAEALYNKLGQRHVLFDDRPMRPGAKLKDADLLGMPIRLTVSRRTVAAGSVEVRVRATGDTRDMPLLRIQSVADLDLVLET